MILAAKVANAIKAIGLKKSEFADILGKQPSDDYFGDTVPVISGHIVLL
jgi:hypothetical protein